MPKRWSTKDLRIIDVPMKGRAGRAEFLLTDHYSVFHFSKMPDQIPDKGEVIARMAASTLHRLTRAGVPNHLISFDPPRTLTVRLLNVLDPARGELHQGDRARLIPLQVIYRNTLPPGASVYRRIETGQASLADLGLDTLPTPNAPLRRPVIEFTTKLEEIDRFVSPDDARAIAHLSESELASIYTMTRRVNSVVCEIAKESGLICADGKVEFGLDENGRVILVDVAGTPDENRFLLNGLHVSKQVLRDFYLPRGLEEEVQQWVSQGRPRSTWPSPEALPHDLIDSVAEMYRSLCETWTGKRTWGASPLNEAVVSVNRALARHDVKTD